MSGLLNDDEVARNLRAMGVPEHAIAHVRAHPGHRPPSPLVRQPAASFVHDPYAGMNKTEARRAQELEVKRRAGEIAGWWYEALTLKLADDTRYTPDFLVQYPSGQLELEEVKGFLREDAAVKIKVAAKLYPFRFTMYQRQKQKQGGGWKVTDYTNGAPP
jgi:hypothetical protein